MRHLAKIRKISDIKSIPGRDSIVLAKVDGWQVIINKKDFSIGDMCIFCEPDSLLPPKPEFEFLRKRCWKDAWNGHLISVIKMGGVVSQGIVFPLSILKNAHLRYEGEDVTEELGIRKYDPEAKDESELVKKRKWFSVFMDYSAFRFFYRLFRKVFPKQDKSWPHWIPKTDEERVQNLEELLMKKYGTPCFYSEKLDGQSGTYSITKGKFIVASRNCWLHKKDNSNYWNVAQKYDIKNIMKKVVKEKGLKSLTIQGEITGPGIQANKYRLPGLYFHIFNVFVNGEKLTTPSDLILWSGILNIPHVPILEPHYELSHSVQAILEMSKGKSKLYDTEREGIVIRAKDGSFSFKAINPDFLVKHAYK